MKEQKRFPLLTGEEADMSYQDPTQATDEQTENKTEDKTRAEGEGKSETTWVEEIEVAGSQLVERVKELIAEGNVRRLIISTHDDKRLLEIPLTAGAVVGGVFTLVAPLLAALGALAALIARVKVQVVRVDNHK
jgi:hypothetical protein